MHCHKWFAKKRGIFDGIANNQLRANNKLLHTKGNKFCLSVKCWLSIVYYAPLRSHFKNSCFVLHQGTQTTRNSKSPRPRCLDTLMKHSHSFLKYYIKDKNLNEAWLFFFHSIFTKSLISWWMWWSFSSVGSELLSWKIILKERCRGAFIRFSAKKTCACSYLKWPLKERHQKGFDSKSKSQSVFIEFFKLKPNLFFNSRSYSMKTLRQIALWSINLTR